MHMRLGNWTYVLAIVSLIAGPLAGDTSAQMKMVGNTPITTVGVNRTPPAFLATRNVAGNPVSYDASALPVLGSTIELSVDLSTTGHTFAQIFAFTDPVMISLGGGQVLLIGGQPLGQSPLIAGTPVARFDLDIPNDPMMAGFTFYTQAVHVAGVQPYALSNAVDLTIGR